MLRLLTNIFCIFLALNFVFFCNCHVIMGSSVFPAACPFLSFWSQNVKSFWQRQRFGWAWARKNSYGFQSWGNPKKNTFLIHTPFQARWWWELETQTSSLAILVFMRIHMRVPMFLWKHIPNVEIFGHHVYRCGNTSLTHMRLQSLCICVATHNYSFTCSESVKSRNACAFPCYLR